MLYHDAVDVFYRGKSYIYPYPRDHKGHLYNRIFPILMLES
jgi:hypothetical protein